MLSELLLNITLPTSLLPAENVIAFEQKINYRSYPRTIILSHPVLAPSFSLGRSFSDPLALCVIKSQNGCISFTNICRLRLPKRIEERCSRRKEGTETRESAILNSHKACGVTVLLTNLRRQDQRGPRRLYKFNNAKWRDLREISTPCSTCTGHASILQNACIHTLVHVSFTTLPYAGDAARKTDLRYMTVRRKRKKNWLSGHGAVERESFEKVSEHTGYSIEAFASLGRS